MTAREHIERFNAAVRSGNWETFVATLAPEAVMRFDGVPVGPYVGREAIAAAYAENPPTDTMAVRSVETDGDTELVRFAWTHGGTGTLTIRRGAGGITELAVSFDDTPEAESKPHDEMKPEAESKPHDEMKPEDETKP